VTGYGESRWDQVSDEDVWVVASAPSERSRMLDRIKAMTKERLEQANARIRSGVVQASVWDTGRTVSIFMTRSNGGYTSKMVSLKWEDMSSWELMEAHVSNALARGLKGLRGGWFN
jgi:hypothetical protein